MQNEDNINLIMKLLRVYSYHESLSDSHDFIDNINKLKIASATGDKFYLMHKNTPYKAIHSDIMDNIMRRSANNYKIAVDEAVKTKALLR